MEVYNVELVTLYNMYNRFIREVQKSASANSSQTKSHDVNRLKSYVSSNRAYLDHIASIPEIDAPETNPQAYVLREPPVLLDVENESAAHCCRYLELARNELTSSQSARNASGIIKFDYDRQMSYLDKVDQFIASYVETSTPLDMPESSPRAPVQGAGKTGLNPVS